MREPSEGYTLYVDGRALEHFNSRPPHRIIELSRLKGIEITPPPENIETICKTDKNQSLFDMK